MAFNHFIPEVWSASILEQFHAQTTLVGLANRADYEGEAKAGNKIHVPGIVDVQIKDYAAAGRTTTPDELADTGIDILIDQEKSFDFLVDDIDRAQAKYSFGLYTESAVRGLVEDAETFLANLLVTTGTALADTTAPTDWASGSNKVSALRRALSAAKVPMIGRYLMVNSAFEEFLLGNDSKLTAADTSGDNKGLREATIGRLSGFNVFTSPFLDDEVPTAVGFHAPSLAFVPQIDKIEAMRAEKKFADRIRGLHVYGGKVLRPTAVQVFKAGVGA